jgi:hypothetical protein
MKRMEQMEKMDRELHKKPKHHYRRSWADSTDATWTPNSALYVKDNGSASVAYGPFKVGGSWADVKDNGSASVAYGGFKVGGSWADNSTVCDSAGNCMVRDSLDVKDNGSASIGYKGIKIGGSWADNATVCDSRGNCMVGDNLWSVGGSFKGLSGSYASK